ncbi:suppressor of lurcher protein 1-like isoform X2 [Watersipora subatra]|uniref:suppressor of lurcher protein 1-like isoform X2 n=1 Tax=Watersipora subatra TaxID=2589382 RepID=UPI00355B2572
MAGYNVYTQTVYFLLVQAAVCMTCSDIIIRSGSSESSKRGNFSSPSYPENYPKNFQCEFKFVGDLNERVLINITDFQLSGQPTEVTTWNSMCPDDYIDIFIEIEHPDHNILELPHQGRYCGNDLSRLPHLLMSLNRTLIIWFDTDGDNQTSRGFFGTYEFISDEPYKMGQQANLGSCGWTMKSDVKMEGYIMAPYYPAVYPDNLNCYYKLEGRPGQRIKLEFIDFDIYYGGDHCPYDSLRIHDGNSSRAPQIGKYCNKINGLVIYSTNHNLYLEFETRSGRPFVSYPWGEKAVRMSGFKAKYTFSDNFVDLGFITDGTHIRGSHCDVRVQSDLESTGVIMSPNFPGPSPSNITCFYYIDGLEDNEHLEKVVLNFEATRFPETGRKRCGKENSYISAYLEGQSSSQEPDDYICSDNIPENIISRDPRLIIKYTTHDNTLSQAIGFQAQFRFAKAYGIGGTPASIASEAPCYFSYRSSSLKNGTINSPRYPDTYPRDITCTYELIAERNEFIMIAFKSFNVSSSNERVGECSGNGLTAISVQSDNETLHVDEFCGASIPGPLLSKPTNQKLILTFKSNSVELAQTFLAGYEFIYKSDVLYGKENITKQSSGIISPPPPSPYKPEAKTVWTWYIYPSNPGAEIQLKVKDIDIQNGTQEGCKDAALRIYQLDGDGFETCGQDGNMEYVASGPISIKFISLLSAEAKRPQFNIIWTEVISDRSGTRSIFDENISNALSNLDILYIIMAVVIVILIIVLIAICVCIKCTSKKPKTRQHSLQKSSKPSEADMPMDLEMVGSDTKTPMLPPSISTNSTFMPYDHQMNNTYSRHMAAPADYMLTDYDHASSTLSDKRSFSPLHSSIHQSMGLPKYHSDNHHLYAADGRLTNI